MPVVNEFDAIKPAGGRSTPNGLRPIGTMSRRPFSFDSVSPECSTNSNAYLEAHNERLRIASSSWRRRKRKPPGCAIECSIWASARRNSFSRKVTGLKKKKTAVASARHRCGWLPRVHASPTYMHQPANGPPLQRPRNTERPMA